MPLFKKIETIAKDIYHADAVIADKSVRDQLRTWEEQGYGHLPVCMAKTQYSFSTDPNLRGAPTGHTVPIREVRLSAGAGFIVVITGEIMTIAGPATGAVVGENLPQRGWVYRGALLGLARHPEGRRMPIPPGVTRRSAIGGRDNRSCQRRRPGCAGCRAPS